MITGFLILVFGLPSVLAQNITLAKEGKSEYVIVLPRHAIPSEKRAAEELKLFLKKIAEVSIPIQETPAEKMILLGDSPSLGPEEYRIEIKDNHLIIVGGKPRGTLYGVYGFLEHLGCRWFNSRTSHIPNLDTIDLPHDFTLHDSPAFEYREPCFTESFDADWSARNRVNSNTAYLNPNAYPDDSYGGRVIFYPFVHTFNQLVPPQKYFSSHPEYFSLVKGKRISEGGQLCLSNPDVLRIAIETVFQWIAEHPEATVYSISQNDHDGWCECERCSRIIQEEGGVSGLLLRFVNAIAEKVHKQHPDKLIETLAYQASQPPPRVTKPQKNVVIRVCPFWCCSFHPFEQCTYPTNKNFVKNLKGWAAISDHIYIWDYAINFSHYLLPFPNFYEVSENLKFYKKIGVKGVFFHGGYAPGGGSENAELRSYVLAKLFWNPSQDLNRLVDEYLEGVYGPASPAMKEYFDFLHHEALPPEKHLFIYGLPDFYDDAFIKKADELFNKAQKLAGSNEAILEEIEKSYLSIRYLKIIRYLKYNRAEQEKWLNDYEEFKRLLDKFGILYLSENQRKEDFFKDYESKIADQ